MLGAGREMKPSIIAPDPTNDENQRDRADPKVGCRSATTRFLRRSAAIESFAISAINIKFKKSANLEDEDRPACLFSGDHADAGSDVG